MSFQPHLASGSNAFLSRTPGARVLGGKQSRLENGKMLRGGVVEEGAGAEGTCLRDAVCNVSILTLLCTCEARTDAEGY